MFKGEDFGMQGLAREFNPCVIWVRSSQRRVVRAVADQGEPGIRSLDADLMFPAGLEPQPQLADEPLPAGERIFGDDFVMGNGLARFVAGGPSAERRIAGSRIRVSRAISRAVRK